MIRFGQRVPEDVDERLADFVEAFALDDRAVVLWLFGSRARGEADALSDVDLAALCRHDLASRASELEQEWTALATDVLGTDEVFVHVLNRAPLTLRYGVLRDARLLWSRRPEAPVDFEARTLKEYFDFQPYLEDYDRELFRQAATGKLR